VLALDRVRWQNPSRFQPEGCAMSKGLDKKKEGKKKPQKSLKEKRAEKQAKRSSR
jgi:hypothetical protein